MILLNSNTHRTLKKALNTAEETARPQEWTRALRERLEGPCDPILVLLDAEFRSNLFASTDSFVDDWLMGVEQWQARMRDPRNVAGFADEVLYQVWNLLEGKLIKLLRRARTYGSFPASGGMLVFLGGLAKCLVVQYQFTVDTPAIHPVAIIRDPVSAFDFWGAIDHADMAARNGLKNILATGHKIIVHRGILVHVDRRQDVGVFGPSIDTLLLNEVLAQALFEEESWQPETALEIGPRNGLITASIINYCPTLKEAIAVDISLNAIICSSRTISNTDRVALGHNKPVLYLVHGTFEASLFNRQYDLVVCNPPYIPALPGSEETTVTADYLHAVSGTELAVDLVKVAPQILRPGGVLVLMCSSLSVEHILSAIPTGLIVQHPLGKEGFRVLFDVEAVFQRAGWLEYLRKYHRLEEENGTYYHWLHPVLIRRG